jgi:hypothetical protein
MYKNIYLILSTLFIWQSTFCQSAPNNKITPDIFKIVSTPSSNQGKVIVNQDDKIKDLVNRYIDYRRKDPKIPGYRIRIFANSGQSARSKALSEEARFKKLFPDIVTYFGYNNPNFTLYVGDFRDMSTAFRTCKLISKEFRNVFVVSANINLPKL